MKTIEIQLYKFSELSETAKQTAIDKWYETEGYPFLSDNLTEAVTEKLHERGCEVSDIKLLYSLGYSQGDGLCFTGTIEKEGYRLELSHRHNYYFSRSITMDFYDKDGEDVDTVEALQDIYFSICREVEKIGYDELEYRMNFDEFSELSDANDYDYTEDGKLY